MSNRTVVAVITAITGDRVIITDEAIKHVIALHFRGIPQDIILETMERVLRNPSDVYRETQSKNCEYDFFYRLESGEFVVVIVKMVSDGAYLSSMYPTGSKHRNKHKKFKKVKL